VEPAEPANWAAAPETAWELEAKKASLLASTWDVPKSLSVDETQDIAAFAKQALLEQSEAPTDSSPYSPESVVSSESHEHAEIVSSESPASIPAEISDWKPSETPWETPVAAHSEPPPEAAPQQATPDVDEIVARVLGKMDPEILQKVTREILKPMIEAIVRDELGKKS
jgi:hypothetical protein